MNNLSRQRAAQLFAAVLLSVGLVASLTLSAVPGNASTLRQQVQPPPSVITIPAGGTATLIARGFCLDFGKPFPTGDMTTRVLAVDKIRAALNYSIQKGYTEGNAQQVQLAIWYLRDNTWHASPHVIADEIVSQATTENMPPATGNAVSLADAVSQNMVSVTAKFVPQTADAFYGDGPVQVKNLGTSDVRIYLAIGSTFSTGSSTFQDLAAYELSLQQGTTTPVASATPATTQQPTTQPTLTAITTPITGTATTTTTITPASTTTVALTATTVATEVATAQVTSTVAATATTAVETPVTDPTATTVTEAPTTAPTPEGNPLPATGKQDTSLASLIALISGISLALVSFGLILRRRHNLS